MVASNAVWRRLLVHSLQQVSRRLSKATGAGIGNQEDLDLLRPFLSFKGMFVIPDNAEFILDSTGHEPRAAVGECSVCLHITSRIPTFPPDCKWIDIPTLPMEDACNAFYHIHDHGERSHPVNSIRLPSVVHHLTAAHQKWGEHRADMLQTAYSKSLAATVELSLSSLEHAWRVLRSFPVVRHNHSQPKFPNPSPRYIQPHANRICYRWLDRSFSTCSRCMVLYSTPMLINELPGYVHYKTPRPQGRHSRGLGPRRAVTVL